VKKIQAYQITAKGERTAPGAEKELNLRNQAGERRQRKEKNETGGPDAVENP